MRFLARILTLMRRLRFYELLLLAFVAVVLGAWSVKEITESAVFCGSTCHIMRPFYQDWKSSEHKDVPCVDCHLEPADQQQFVPEFRALGQVASYLTRAYSVHTRAEVSDANCLTEECHSRRLLDGRVTFAKGIAFDHTPHLQRLRRGKILRCTTCHSRVAMGEHVTVVVDTCFICHFRRDGGEPATSECTLCHDPSLLAADSRQGPFGHLPYIQRGVRCQSCHQGVTRGDGRVKADSCRDCHESPMEILLSEPVEFLHRLHVTDHKVDCGTCHESIRHNGRMELSETSHDCGACHENRHSGIWSMYSGQGAVDVPTRPSPMNRARVGCNGCHSVPSPAGGIERKLAGTSMVAVRSVCETCHEEDLGPMIEKWEREIDGSLARGEHLLLRIREGSGNDPDPEELRLLEQAERNLHFVRYSSPLHNADYALAILEKTIEDLDRISEKNKQR